MKDGRGQHNIKKKLARTEKLKVLIRKNPEWTKGNLCREMGMTYKTLQSHLKAIKEAG